LKIKALSPLLGLSIMGSGLIFPTIGKMSAETSGLGAESAISIQVAQVNSDVPELPIDVPDVIPANPEIEGQEESPEGEEEPIDAAEPGSSEPIESGEPSPAPSEAPEPTIFFPSDLPESVPQTPPPPATQAPAAAPDPVVLVSEVLVEGTTDPALQNAVYEAIATRPGQTATRTQIQSDINAVYATGFFNNVQAQPSDTPLGVRVTFVVSPNPVLRSVQLAGNKVLTEEKADEIFADQYGKVLNLNDLQSGIEKVNKYYQDSGYVLGQVLPGSERIDGDGTVTLQVAEGEIEGIGVRFQDDEGEPTKGQTKEYIITREMRTQPGEILNRDKLQNDLQQIFGLGLFEDVQVALEPGQDPRKVVVNLNVQERKTGSFSAGAGFSSNSGLFGTGSYSQSNLLGRNYDFNAQAQVGTRDFLFDIGFTNPWIKGDPYRTSYTINAFNRLTLPLVFDNGVFDETTIDDVQDQFRFRQEGEGFVPDTEGDFIGFEVEDDNGQPRFRPTDSTIEDDADPSPAADILDNPPCGILTNPGSAGQPCDVRVVDTDENDQGNDIFDSLDTPRVNRLGGGISFTRALTKNPDKRARAWVASAGVKYERVSIRDSDLDLVRTDELGNPLSFSGFQQQQNGERITRSQDDLFSVQLGIARDLRNDALSPTKGALIRAGVEQTVPIGAGSIAFTRLRGSYSHFLPVGLLKREGPQALAFNVQGGTVIGDLPPYEAFNLGGSNSIRGFRDGSVGSGRSFLQATAEYRFPLLKFLGGIGGVLFVDYGTVLGTDDNVPGNPSIIRGKPGDGFGFGGGVRVKTPIGPVRIDYAINDSGDDRFHFGFGERF
jgi:outer membrane protein assembly factor BamA